MTNRLTRPITVAETQIFARAATKIWGKAGSGKRGGARVIYFFYHSRCPLYLLLAYTKVR